MQDGVDIAVVGAGIVGAAIGQAAAERGFSVAVLEREERPASGVTARNSGVVHAGLYYPPGSLRAVTCIEGNRRLREWARKFDLPFAQPGKLIPARTDAEQQALADLHANARDSGAPGLALLTGEEVARREPQLPGVREALFSATTGIVDATALCHSLLADTERRGGLVLMRAAVLGVNARSGDFVVDTGRGQLMASLVINAAAWGAPAIAALLGDDAPRLYPCRGDWFRLRRPGAWNHLVYPARPHGALGLGVHLTLDLAGGVRLGPDAEFVADPGDLAPAEGKNDKFRAAAEALLGPLPGDALAWESCGMRPKLRAPGEAAEKDFLLQRGRSGAVHLFGIESPGLTAALALARRVLDGHAA